MNMIQALGTPDYAPPAPRYTSRQRAADPRMIAVWRLAGDEMLEDLLREPGHLDAFIDEDGPELNLDQAWHGLHYLLTGGARATAGPRGYILGGRLLATTSIGFGPARILTSGEVAIFGDLLQCISLTDLRQRFDPEAMSAAEVHPNIWERALTGEQDVFAYLAEHFTLLRRFIAGARRDGMGAVTYFA